ncbi:MAG: hypothetical protein JWO78_2019 [Micavibrio sp.]|nr:hypothetical protein [Micavibrio sp.]
MIPIIKPVAKDSFPFRRMLRSERPASTLFTTIAGHTNENDLLALQYSNMLLSVEDINVLTQAQEETQQLAQAAYAALPPADEDQISFYFIEKKQAGPETPVQPVGSLLNEEL